MKVILTQNIKGVGQIGDVKSVSDGHARNYLIPRGFAKLATAKAKEEAETFKRKLAASRAMIDETKLREYAQRLEGLTIEFKKKSNSSGTLFSSVTKQEIAKELSKKSGYEISEEMIDLGEHGEHIKKIGNHEIKIKPGPETSVQITISIT